MNMRKYKSRRALFCRQRIVFFLICILATILIYSSTVFTQPDCFAKASIDIHAQKGIASWYGKRFHGRKTAAGERYNMYELTAAHRYLPLGSIVKVRNLTNNRQVTVRINDRGPYIRGRIIDLSLAAACELRMVRQGIATVKLEVLSLGI